MSDATPPAFYLGIPKSGKTTLARRHLMEDISSNGNPALVFDLMRVAGLRDIYHARTVEEVLERVWPMDPNAPRQHTAFYGRDLDDVNDLMGACEQGKDVNVLVDEVSIVMGPHYLSENMGLALRGHRHCRMNFRATTQSFGDVHQTALSCSPTLFIYCTTGPRSLQRLRGEFGIEPETVRTLPQFQYVTHKQGF